MDAVLGMVGGVVGKLDVGARVSVTQSWRRILVGHADVGDRIPRPLTAGRTGVNLNAIPIGALSELCGDPGLTIKGQRLLNVERGDLNCRNRLTKNVTASGQRHLDK